MITLLFELHCSLHCNRIITLKKGLNQVIRPVYGDVTHRAELCKKCCTGRDYLRRHTLWGIVRELQTKTVIVRVHIHVSHPMDFLLLSMQETQLTTVSHFSK